jgi:restriction system protein
MEIPKFDETFIPILEILKSGNVYKTRELIEEVKLKFFKGLNEDQLKKKPNQVNYLLTTELLGVSLT